MELILINESKLKIMLSPDDMQKYELCCDSVDYSSTETRRAFWNILDQAKHRTGFDAASERVYIQLYPSRDGGCEMYVTKIGMICTPQVHGTDAKPRIVQNDIACVFPDMTSLLRACKAVLERKIACKSRAYTGDAGSCMLFLRIDLRSSDTERLAFIGEFGEIYDCALAQAYANEHYRCICKENAVQTLARLA